MSVIIDQISVEMINEQENVSLEKIIKTETQGWRDVSAVMSTCYSDKVPGFGSQHPQGSSHQALTPVPENLKFSSALNRHFTKVVSILTF